MRNFSATHGTRPPGKRLHSPQNLVETQKPATAGVLRHRERIFGGLEGNRNCKSRQVLVALSTSARYVMKPVVCRSSPDFDTLANPPTRSV